MSLLEIENLNTSFHLRGATVRAVSNVSFAIDKAETVGIVGESGCGKSVSCLSMLRLIPQPPGQITGKVKFDGIDLLSLKEQEIRAVRGNRITMVFQDPLTSLNPYLRVSEQLTEPLLVHCGMKKNEALDKAISLLSEVGISNAKQRIQAYPHEFSGGMRQRVMIAMALITNPQILIADEPTTALDVTVQAQILALMEKLQQSHHMSIIFITHNLGVVARLCTRVIVMYAGQIVESTTTRDLFYHTSHPYTHALIKSIPSAQSIGKLWMIPGMPPDLSKPLNGCPFLPRCQFAKQECAEMDCVLRDIGNNHQTACIRMSKGELAL